jgi:hypothetical protein
MAEISVNSLNQKHLNNMSDYKCIKTFLSATGKHFVYGSEINSISYSSLPRSEQANFTRKYNDDSRSSSGSSYSSSNDSSWLSSGSSPDYGPDYGNSSDSSSSDFGGFGGGDSGGAGSSGDW